MNNCNIMTQHTKKFVANFIFNISRDAVIKVNNIVCSVQEAVLTTTQVYAFGASIPIISIFTDTSNFKNNNICVPLLTVGSVIPDYVNIHRYVVIY